MHPTTLPLNTTDIHRDELDIAAQVRTNPLPWKGQFSPQLVEVLLREYATPGSHVLDPFVGSGTVLGESVRQGHSATGVEINPAAVLLAKLYEWTNVPRSQRLSVLAEVRHSLERIAAEASSPSGAIANLVTLRPQDYAALASTCGDAATRRLVQAILVLADPKWSEVSYGRVLSSYGRVRELILGLPEGPFTVNAHHADARRIPLGVGECDLVVTSPPYINVFNYHQQYRPAVEALDHDVLEAARSEIGSNRKHRMNRFLTVVQYALDMSLVLDEMRRTLRQGGRAIVVIGRESMVRGARIPNGKLLSEVAQRGAGLMPLMRQERSFRNRFGEVILEDILHFRREGLWESAPVEGLISLSRATLGSLLPTVSGDVRDDVTAAIDAAECVKPSPFLDKDVSPTI